MAFCGAATRLKSTGLSSVIMEAGIFRDDASLSTLEGKARTSVRRHGHRSAPEQCTRYGLRGEADHFQGSSEMSHTENCLIPSQAFEAHKVSTVDAAGWLAGSVPIKYSTHAAEQ